MITKLKPQHNILRGAKLEFGNADQIKKLKDHEAYEEEFLDGRVDLDHKEVTVNIRATVYFTCPECGNKDVDITLTRNDVHSEWHAISLIDEDEGKCAFCKSEFVLSEDGFITIVENPNHPEKLQSDWDNENDDAPVDWA